MLPNDVAVLGDPHLGRKFNNVPLHRRGDREAMQWNDFENVLLRGDFPMSTDTHVMMGDLFDKFTVPYEVILRAAHVYCDAAALFEGVNFVILRGNHDVSRDSDRASAFDVFKHLVAGVENIFVVDEEPTVIGFYGFVPYHPFRATEDLVSELPDDLEAVFGHWDIQDWGGDNVVPTALLARKDIPLAISGHDHLPRVEKRHGVEIQVIGSMQPYSHAEDPEGDLYVTLTLDGLAETDVRDKNVRLLLHEGEELPSNLDCLSLVSRREDQVEEVQVDTSDFENLDVRGMLSRALSDLPCHDQVMERFDDQ